MVHKLRINLTKNSRKGKQRLKAIVVISLPEFTSQDQLSKTREDVKKRPMVDSDGIIWLVTSNNATVKVYNINS